MVFGSNLFDFAHFRAVHKFYILSLKTYFDSHHMGWERDIEGVRLMRAEVAAVATAISCTEREGELPMRHIAGITPQGDDGLGIFMTVLADLADDSEATYQDAVRRLDELEALHRHLPTEDLPILNSIEFGELRLTKVDTELGNFLRYVNRYPRTTIKKLQSDLKDAAFA